jgi:hypothetical protein
MGGFAQDIVHQGQRAAKMAEVALDSNPQDSQLTPPWIVFTDEAIPKRSLTVPREHCRMPRSWAENTPFDPGQERAYGLGRTSCLQQMPAATLGRMTPLDASQHSRTRRVMVLETTLFERGLHEALSQHSVHEGPPISGPLRQSVAKEMFHHGGPNGVIPWKAIAEEAIRIVTRTLPLRARHLVPQHGSDLEIGFDAWVERIDHPTDVIPPDRVEILRQSRLNPLSQLESTVSNSKKTFLNPVPHELDRKERIAARSLFHLGCEGALQAEKPPNQLDSLLPRQGLEVNLYDILAGHEFLNGFGLIGVRCHRLVTHRQNKEAGEWILILRIEDLMRTRRPRRPPLDIVEPRHERTLATQPVEPVSGPRIKLSPMGEAHAPAAIQHVDHRRHLKHGREHIDFVIGRPEGLEGPVNPLRQGLIRQISQAHGILAHLLERVAMGRAGRKHGAHGSARSRLVSPL